MTKRGISHFLKAIGIENNVWYQKIDEIYVAPKEFDLIKDVLERERVAILIGAKEYGKTYTSLKLLWEYYKRGYEARYIRTHHENKAEVRIDLARNTTISKGPLIACFEDPFGTLVYQYDEALERDIGAILDTFRGSPDAYIIITSRDEVYKEFKHRRISEINLTKFEVSLNMRGSYDYERRQKMLLGISNVLKCEWLDSNTPTNYVLEKIRNQNILSSPLKIRDFAISTIHVTSRDELDKQLTSKSREVAMSLAEEFKRMARDKILFLLLLYVSDKFERRVLESVYWDLVTKLEINSPWSFSRILEWFLFDKVLQVDSRIQMSHESYYEGLEHVLHKRGYPSTLLSEIYEIILPELLKIDNIRNDAIDSIVRSIEFLPPKFVKMLEESLGSRDARKRVFESIFLRRRFYNRGSLQLLSIEDKFFLSGVLDEDFDDDRIVIPEKGLAWKKVWKNILYVRWKFNENVSEKILSIVCSSQKFIDVGSPYYQRMFDELIEFKIKKILRDRYYMTTQEIYDKIVTDPIIVEFARTLSLILDRPSFIHLLNRLSKDDLVRRLGGNYVKATRQLVNSTPSEIELDLHQRIVNYIIDIPKYMPYSKTRISWIQELAISYSEKIKNHQLLEGKEPLRIAAVLVFHAGKGHGLKYLSNYITSVTGVSRTYFSNTRGDYAQIINGIK